MEALPIMQYFLGSPVRVYRVEFQVEMRGHYDPSSAAEIRGRNNPQSFSKFVLQTFAIPFPDVCSALSYDERAMRRLIDSSAEAFAGLWRVEQLPDALGRTQQTILLSQEMVDGLIFKLHTSRIKDPETRARVIDFQRFIMITIGLIRRGKLKAVRDASFFNVPPAYQNLLALQSSRALAAGIKDLAVVEGKSISTIYRKLTRYRGSNVITRTGRPRKRRSEKRS